MSRMTATAIAGSRSSVVGGAVESDMATVEYAIAESHLSSHPYK